MLDTFLKDQLEDSPPSKFTEFRENLPVFDAKAEILDRIRRHRVVIISGETGSGKTTQVTVIVTHVLISNISPVRTKV
jgi:HrpA-like RNA helicase